MTSNIKLTEVYVAKDDGSEDAKKMAFMPQKSEQKGNLLMDPMAKSSW